MERQLHRVPACGAAHDLGAGTEQRSDLSHLRPKGDTVLAGRAVAGSLVDWDFWLVGTSVHERIRAEVNQTNRPRGLALEWETTTGRCKVWVVQWSELIEARRAELAFFQEQFRYSPAAQAAVERLRVLHPDHVPAADSLTPGST